MLIYYNYYSNLNADSRKVFIFATGNCSAQLLKHFIMVYNLDFTRDELETLRVSLCNREDVLESRISRCPNENFYRVELEKASDLLSKLLNVG